MRWRWLLLIAVTSGVIATYAVAWGCALWSKETTDQRWDSFDHDHQPPPSWPAEVPAAWLVDPHSESAGQLRADYEEIGGLGLAHGKCAVGRVYGGSGTVFQHWLVYWRAGLPFKALQCEGVQEYPGPRGSMYGGVPAPAWLRPIDRTNIWDMVMEGNYMPLLPRWPGFLVDVALYGCAVLLFLAGLGSARRFIRHAAGRCSTCGYDRRGLVGGADAKCPECGTVPAAAAK
jgi:hypothetical protein